MSIFYQIKERPEPRSQSYEGEDLPACRYFGRQARCRAGEKDHSETYKICVNKLK